MDARTSRTFLHAVRLVAPLVAFLAAPAVQAQSGGMTTIENRASVRYVDANGKEGGAEASAVIQLGTKLVIWKQVSDSVGVAGDTLRYVIRWQNAGAIPAGNVALVDELPAALAYVQGSATARAGARIVTAGRTLSFELGDVAAMDSGVVAFRAVVQQDSGLVENIVRANYDLQGSAQVVLSNPARTRLMRPDMALELTAVTDRTLRVGDTLTYRLRIYNRSTQVALRQIVLKDSLPIELQYMNATPSPDQVTVPPVSTSVTGAGGFGGLASWYFGEIEPGGMREVLLHTTVMSAGNGELVNSASANGAGMHQALAAVSVVAVEQAQGNVVVTVRSSSLEAALGDVVGFTITIADRDRAAFGGSVIRTRLPDGLTVQPSSVTGGTLTQQGRELSFALAPNTASACTTLSSCVRLEASTLVRVTFAAVVSSARVPSLRTLTWAETNGLVISDTAATVVRARGAALMTRALLGKVWLDDNGDGRQQAGERGLEHALIWSSHGETARVDAEGRFSFPDMRQGRYTLRIDPLSVPAGYLPADAVTVRVDGWSTAVVSFAVRRGAAVLSAAASSARGITLPNGTVSAGSRITAPADGTVFGTNRAFVRVVGEASAAVELYDGTRLIASSVLRPDGSEDFIGVELEPGAHTLETRVRAASGEQRHAVQVHVSGAPRRVVRTDSATIRAGQSAVLALRVVDEWNVAVAQKPFATVAGENLRILENDATSSSLGLQLPVNADGMLLVPVRGDSTGAAKLTVSFGDTSVEVMVTLLPEIRPLIVVADGEIGIGAAPQTYGSIVARGALDANTAVTVSYDSRRRADDAAFGGVIDPLGESRYPVLGDASQRDVLRGSTTPLSLRVERNRSWLLLGDLDTRGFGDDLSPGQYRRSLPGVSARISAGAATLLGFGSSVAQGLVDRQLRGNGTSGPYDLGGAIRLGTDRVAIETRDRLNASLVVSRQELERFVDYDIDASTGTILLRRPLASADANGNPLMLVAAAEQLLGAAAFVGGLRAELDGTRLLRGADSLTIGAAFIQDRTIVGGHTLISGDVRSAFGWGGGRVELAHSAGADSSGLALHAFSWLGSASGTGARISWDRVGDGFANAANPRLVAGTEDVRVSGRAEIGNDWALGAAFQRQWFRSRGADRAQTSISAERVSGNARIQFDLGLLDESMQRDTATIGFRSLYGKLTYSPGRHSLWLEGTEPLRADGATPRPRTVAMGGAYDVGHGVKLEASHRLIDADSARQGITTLGVRTDLSTGTRAWSQYELSSNPSGTSSAAVLGVGQKLRVTQHWSVDGQYERRVGLSSLPETDPLRGLPFVQQERDRWSASAGVAWQPAGDAARANVHAELSDADGSGRSYRVLGTGEMSLSQSWALLLRQENRSDRSAAAGATAVTRRAHSLLGMAFRPADRSDFTSLVKLEWRRDDNPRRGNGALLEGVDERVIGAIDAIYTPAPSTEFGLRYALRRAARSGELAGDALLRSSTHFAGARLRRDLTDRLDVRANARLLMEQRSGTLMWDLAPALGVTILNGLELEAGYRLGGFEDADFAQNGGHGWYAALGMSITEKSGAGVAGFWQDRIARKGN
ncbi:MAG TPA: DUF11 domain-containing protein [Longimicrobiales bacterium]|nr:DUF11 domain-containing protein [Longimicrobiales bacterium]